MSKKEPRTSAKQMEGVDSSVAAAEPADLAGGDGDAPAGRSSGAGADGNGAADDDFPVEVEVDAGNVADLEGKLAVLEEQKQQLEREKKELHDRLLRSVADLENFRKRARKEADDARNEAQAKALREMLPVLDNLERALEHAAAGGQADGTAGQVVEGVQLVVRQFSQSLERFDVKPVEALGKAFDPNVHEAIAQAPASAETPAGTVVSVMQKGYTIGSRLLRPSLVVVATAVANSDGANGDASGEH